MIDDLERFEFCKFDEYFISGTKEWITRANLYCKGSELWIETSVKYSALCRNCVLAIEYYTQ